MNLGWLGAAPLFLALIYVLLTGVGSLVAGRRNNDEDYRFAIALFCVFIAGCVSGVFESWFTSVGSIFCFPFWFCAMLFVKASRHMKDRDPTLSNMSPAISG